jgi:hypothetical protein
MPVRQCKTLSDTPYYYESCQKTKLEPFLVQLLRFNVIQWSTVFRQPPSSADNQRSSLVINKIETRTAINDIIAHDEYQTCWWGTQWDCLGFLPKQTLSELKNVTRPQR